MGRKKGKNVDQICKYSYKVKYVDDGELGTFKSKRVYVAGDIVNAPYKHFCKFKAEILANQPKEAKSVEPPKKVIEKPVSSATSKQDDKMSPLVEDKKRNRPLRNPFSPRSRQYLLRRYSHHVRKRTLPGKAEAQGTLMDGETPSPIKRREWEAQKNFIRSYIQKIDRLAAKL